MPKKEDKKLFTKQEHASSPVEAVEQENERENMSKMINASRAFRNLPPEFIMGNSDRWGKE